MCKEVEKYAANKVAEAKMEEKNRKCYWYDKRGIRNRSYSSC